MAQEHQEYIQTKVNPILENLVTQVLLERPDNPVPFMVRWLANQSPQAKEYFAGFGMGEADKLRTEVKTLQEEVRELEQKLGCGPVTKDKAADDDEEEEEEDDEGPDEPLPPPGAYLQKGPRSSVSAEAYGDWNKQKAFTPPVHPKSEDQKERILGVLKQSFLFNTLELESLNILVGAMIEKGVKTGERLIQEGDDGDVMYVIEKGVADCSKKIDGAEKVVKTCGAGDFFGELALLYNCPRAASVDAKEDLTLWQLDRETFNHIVRDASMKKRQQYEDFLKSVGILKSLGDYERSQLADSLQKETVPAGKIVITQGEDGSKFYLVEDGELVANKSAAPGEPQKEVLTYKKGDFFGELALINDEKRQATVVARSDSKLLWIDRRGFKTLLGPLKDDMQKYAATTYA
mmetsp:Transcript_110621/g.277098  ORF Transcript_110621/g.277098 Transcript_110621/m.277098 type:complete len:405 (-) Transcript_110621:41-1255(-)